MKLKLRTFFPLIVIAFIGCVVVWWKVTYPSYSFHYKITVEIETPEGIKSGSAVREVTVSRQPKIGDAPSVIFDVRGEAVAVDLGQRGVVFSLINWDSDRDVYYALNTMDKNKLKVGMKAILPNNPYFPQFVTFTDLNDPTTLLRLSYGDLSEVFGEGIKTKRVIVEITDDPVEYKIDSLINRFGGSSGMYHRDMFQRKGN